MTQTITFTINLVHTIQTFHLSLEYKTHFEKQIFLSFQINTNYFQKQDWFSMINNSSTNITTASTKLNTMLTYKSCRRCSTARTLQQQLCFLVEVFWLLKQLGDQEDGPCRLLKWAETIKYKHGVMQMHVVRSVQQNLGVYKIMFNPKHWGFETMLMWIVMPYYNKMKQIIMHCKRNYLPSH